MKIGRQWIVLAMKSIRFGIAEGILDEKMITTAFIRETANQYKRIAEKGRKKSNTNLKTEWMPVPGRKSPHKPMRKLRA